MFVWASPSIQLNLPVAVSPASLSNFGAYIRDIYRLHFAHEVAAGALKSLILPYAVLGSFILPVFYFTVPHVNRPWLYHARWALMAFILVFNLYETWTSSSANFAIGYAVGLMQAWGILWSAMLLVWMRPQFEAERVEKRLRARGRGRAEPVATVNGDDASNGHATRENGHVVDQSGHDIQQQHIGNVAKVNGHHTSHRPENGKVNGFVNLADTPDEDIARSLKEGYEYYWQAYPADAPFITRLGWSIDLVMSFRGTGKTTAYFLSPFFQSASGINILTCDTYLPFYIGWNWCVPVIPHFAKPEKPLSGALVDLSSIPVVTRQGYRRYRTNAEWLRAQVLPLILCYFTLDLLSVLMMKDPYFILGPEFANAAATIPSGAQNPLALPPFLASLHPVLLQLYHSLICFVAVLVAINLIMTSWQLSAHFVMPRALLTGSARGELWHYPDVYGSFVTNVLDRGIAGFWGGWWHQTFRTAFSAPSIWLARRGWIDARSVRGKAVAGLLAFAQSGFLHALGSVSCLPPSKPWMPAVFFLLCWVGVIVQNALVALVHNLLLPVLLGRPQEKPLPTWLRRTGNFVFVFVYLNVCQTLFCDDLARSGIWLLEPVPASLFRALGLGKPGDSWWRWDPAIWPRWYYGGRSRWWESGIAL